MTDYLILAGLLVVTLVAGLYLKGQAKAEAARLRAVREAEREAEAARIAGAVRDAVRAALREERAALSEVDLAKPSRPAD